VRLAVGTRLGPYQIQAAIGAGLAGDICRARDTRLDQAAAVRVLPPQLTADTDCRARLEGEARAIAGLDRPRMEKVLTGP
jgi:hypothetical protein